MSDRVFLDTNLWIYLYSDKIKGRKVKQLVAERFEYIVVSTQVLGELFHVLTKKGLKDKKEAKEIVTEIAGYFQVASITLSTVIRAINLHVKHSYSYWDSLIISSALENGCKLLYSEDLQADQVIESKLKIVTPL
jgi:predicted nucleic acid-binding protein